MKGTNGTPLLGLSYRRSHLKLSSEAWKTFLDLIVNINDRDTMPFLSVCHRYFVSFDKALGVDF